jgi:hypothetical protein
MLHIYAGIIGNFINIYAGLIGNFINLAGIIGK